MRGFKRGRGKVEREKEKYRVNGTIRAAEVRVIAEDGKMMGVHTSRDALKLAEDLGLDLIEIAPNAKPPTCRIMDYGKWKYENKKKQAIARKKQTVISIKEIQIRPRTDDHDLNVKLRHARRFLLDGDKVKVNLRFSGREMAHQELGYKLLIRVSGMLTDIANVETQPKKEGRQMFILMTPDSIKIKDLEKSGKLGKDKVASSEEAKASQEEAKSEKKDSSEAVSAKTGDAEQSVSVAEG